MQFILNLQNESFIINKNLKNNKSVNFYISDQYSLLKLYKYKIQNTYMTSYSKTPTQPPPYIGLINEGSTCYLNSLIQTLFMTPEFRKNVYAYVHNQKKLQFKNSIPYQLQKLFVMLQTQKVKLVNTKGLLKSFQWTEADAFQQHDVQQFCRKLFQAIEISNKKAHWITDLFEGSMVSFVDCGKHLSQKQQTFLDISLAIHNPYTKVRFSSLEQALKEYLKSQKLQDKFSCEQCGQKVEVQKGMKICRLPPLLTIQLNRFQLNYQTWQRQKVNNFLYFPELLYMGKFMKKYEEIEISQLPADLKSKVKVTEKQQSARTKDIFAGQNNNNFEMNNSKVKPKRKNSDEIQSTKAKVFFFDEQKQRQKEQKSLTIEEEKQRNRQILADLKNQKSQIDQKVKAMEKKEVQSLEDDMLFGSGMGFLVDNGPMEWNSGAIEKESQSARKPIFSKTQVAFEHQEQVFDPSKQYPDNTYMLYAVLVHSGGAYGGHYYAYISNGKQWFRFDDSVVRKVNRFQMRKYGNLQKMSSGSNAYLLFYRDVRTFKQSNPDSIQIPAELLEKMSNDKSAPVTKMDESRTEKLFQQIMQGVMIKLINLTQSKAKEDVSLSSLENQSIFIENRYEQTIGSLKERVKSVYPELESIVGNKNWRLRRFNKLQESLHEVYSEEYDNVLLENLGFRETVWVAVETKTDEEVFEDYDPKQISVKINIWRPDITLVTEKHLKPLKLQISQQAPFTSLVQKISKTCNIPNPTIIKRNFSQSNPIYIYPNSDTKKLIQLKFFNGINLYIEEPFVQKKSRWVEEFESEKYRCQIKYNNPSSESQSRDHEVYFDTRKTLKQLKDHLSKLINLPFEDFRIKKSRQSVSELTAYNKKLCDLKFIANEFIFLQKGRSSCGVVILKQGRVEVIDGRIEFNLLGESMVQLDQTMLTVGDIIFSLSQQLNIPQQLLRVRQYKAYQFGEIYRLSQSIQKIKDKSLVWERLKSPQISEMKGLQLYVRVFDVMNLELGELKEVYADSTATYEEFACILQEELGIPANRVLVWKALSNYVEKEILIDSTWLQVAFIRRQIKQQPLYVMNDGEIFIIKQAETPYHSKLNYTTTSNGASIKERGKQAQLKITVMADNSDEEEEMIKQALTASIQQNNHK